MEYGIASGKFYPTFIKQKLEKSDFDNTKKHLELSSSTFWRLAETREGRGIYKGSGL